MDGTKHSSFEVPTVSLHVHERIDPMAIRQAVRKPEVPNPQGSLFKAQAELLPLRSILEFYHAPDFQTVAIPQRGRLQNNPGTSGSYNLRIDTGFAMVYGNSLHPRLFGSSNEPKLFAPKKQCI